MISTTLQWKISKTKKRLFDPIWETPCMIITIMGLFAILAFGMRAISLTWNFGFVRSYIPVLEQNFEENLIYEPIPNKSITSTTVVIFLTDHAFYFGNFYSFGNEYFDATNKFSIPHLDGAPQILLLTDTLKQWLKNKSYSKTAVLFISPDWPMSVVIQVIQYLKISKIFDEVVLGGGYF
jgi:hypothetical protein